MNLVGAAKLVSRCVQASTKFETSNCSPHRATNADAPRHRKRKEEETAEEQRATKLREKPRRECRERNEERALSSSSTPGPRSPVPSPQVRMEPGALNLNYSRPQLYFLVPGATETKAGIIVVSDTQGAPANQTRAFIQANHI